MKKVLLTSLFLLLSCSIIEANELKEHLKTFIDLNCCYTNNCCFPISAKDVTDLGNGKYIINITGQEIIRKGYSPDGQYWRCACEHINGNWTVFKEAFTRCLYTPRSLF